MRKCVIFPNPYKPEVIQMLPQLISVLEQEGFEWSIDAHSSFSTDILHYPSTADYHGKDLYITLGRRTIFSEKKPEFHTPFSLNLGFWFSWPYYDVQDISRFSAYKKVDQNRENSHSQIVTTTGTS